MNEREQLNAWKREAEQRREQERKELEQRRNQPKPPIQQESQQEKDHREFELKKRILELNGGNHIVYAVSDKFLSEPGNPINSLYTSYSSKADIGDLTERQAAQVLYVLETRKRKEENLRHPNEIFSDATKKWVRISPRRLSLWERISGERHVPRGPMRPGW